MRISDWSSDVCSSDLEQAERNQHEAGERCQLEFNEGDEELDGEDEEGEQDQRPGQEHAGDLDEVLEEGPVAHETGDRVEQRPTGVEPGLRHLAGAEQIRRGEARTADLQDAHGEAIDDDTGEVVPVADKVGEDAGEPRLMYTEGPR